MRTPSHIRTALIAVTTLVTSAQTSPALAMVGPGGVDARTDVVVMRRVLTQPHAAAIPTPVPSPTPTPAPSPGPAPTPSPVIADSWDVGEWTFDPTAPACSEAAHQSRTVTCVAGGAAVPDARCDDTKPDDGRRVVRHEGCRTDWATGAYGTYDSSCSSTAIRRRAVQCQRSGTDYAPVVIADDQCDLTARPAESDASKRFGGCTNAWRYADYGNFDSTCSAAATRVRTAECRRSNDAQPSAILAADLIAPAGACGERETLSDTRPNYSDCGGVLSNAGFETLSFSGWTVGGANGVPVITTPGAGGTGAAARFIKAEGTISQTVTTYAVNYAVTFSAYATAGYPVRLFWNGVYVNKCGVGTNNAWTSCSFVLAGDVGNSTITFQGPVVSTQARIDDVVLAVAP